MRKNILLICSVILFSVAVSFSQDAGQRWIFYGRDVKGKEYYYDAKIRKTSSGTLTVWSKISSPDISSYDLQLFEYDCQKAEIKLLKGAEFSEGEITSSEVVGKWEIPIPNSMNEAALDAVCGNSKTIKSFSENKSLAFNFQIRPPVEKSVDFYKSGGRSTMEDGLYRSGMFMLLARRIFREESVPENIAWIGQLASSWKPESPTGLWRINNQVAAKYGLKKNIYVNEVNDFEEATRAAAKYLKFLAEYYGNNWELTIAAYFSGKEGIDLAIKKVGVADYWKIRQYLPKEAQSYVPSVLATILIANNPNQYGFGNIRPAAQLQYDRVRVPASTNLSLLAQASDTSVEYLRYLNPHLRTNMTPPEPYIINVPVGKLNEVVALFRKSVTRGDYESIMSAKSSQESSNSAAEDLGIDTAVVSVERAGLLENFDSTNSVLQLQKGAVLALIDRTPKNDFYNVVDITTSVEGWVDKRYVTIRLTAKPILSPTFEEKRVGSNTDPTLIIKNQTAETLNLRLGERRYTIPANSEKSIVVSAGTYKFYGSVPNAIPRIGEKYFPKGIIYYWRFFIITEEK
jgi:hypothetical protein